MKLIVQNTNWVQVNSRRHIKSEGDWMSSVIYI
jgi:hypothetical protein